MKVIAFSAALASFLPVVAHAQTPAAPTTPVLPTLPAAAPAATGVSGSISAPPLPTVSTPATLPSSAPLGPVASDYKLDVDDMVSVSVTRHGDVGGTYRIPPDGLVRLQRLTTPIDARGKTVAELIALITDKLTTEGKLRLRPGQVSVVIVGMRMHRVFVRGNAVGGREFDLRDGWRVADIVALMGGVPPADRLTARITNPQRPAPISFDLAQALTNPTSPDNVTLQEGDTLMIAAPQMKRLTVKGEGPRGIHEVDERFGLRTALLSMGFTTNGATGDLHHARIIRNATPGDFESSATYMPVDLYALITNDATPDMPFHDLDTLDIPVSDDYIYVLGEIGGPRKWYLPQDRKTYLVDVYANAGNVTGNAKIGSVKVYHPTLTGSMTNKTYDLGKFLKNADNANNPQIFPHDIVYVPTNNRVNPVSSIYTTWSIFGIMKALVPGL